LNILTLFTQRWLFGAAVLLGLSTAACGPAPLGVGWPAVSKVGDQQNILLAFNNQVTLIDSSDGKPVELLNEDGNIRVDEAGNPRLWTVTGGEQPAQFYSHPALLNDDSLLIAAYDKKLFEVDVPTARVENPTGALTDGHVVAGVTLGDDLIYLGYSEGDLAAFNRSDLSEAWTFDTNHGVWDAPVLVDDTLYFSSLDHNLYAVDAETGDLRWALDLGGAATSKPLYANERLYIGSFARKVYEISTSGEILNEYATDDWIWGTPTIVDNVLYTADVGGNVYALNVDDGFSLRWKAAKVAARAIRPTPLVADNYVVVTSRDQQVYWLNREDGSVITDWTRQLQGEVLADILLIEPDEERGIDEPLVVVGTNVPQELLVAFTLERGERQWTYVQQ
jgi:outer membrane protein assembly factor BamB